MTNTLAPASPSPVPAFLESVPYHRLALLAGRPRWWRPLATVAAVAAVAVAYLALALVAAAAVVVAAVVDPALAGFLIGEELDLASPVGALVGYGFVALLLPAIAGGVALVEKRGPGTLGSVAGRLRPSRLRRAGLRAVPFVVLALIPTALDLARGDARVTWTPASAGLIAVALLVVPLQSAAEEYAFRGLPMQLLGSWLRHPLWGVLAPIPLFVLGHGYDPAGQVGVAFFALTAGVLVWRTGGLEAAIVLHAVNNSAGMQLGAVGLSDLNVTQVGWGSSLYSCATTAVYAGLVLWDEHRIGARDTISR